MAKGNVAVAVGLMVIFAGSSAVCSPLLLGFLLPLMAKGSHSAGGRVQAGRYAARQPVAAVVRRALKWRPAMADKLQHPADRMSAAPNLCALGLIVVAQFQTLAAIRARGFIGMLSLVATSMAAGWLLGETGS
jgi:hypothetical protein